MTSFLRRNAIALVALFVALGGTSIAAVGTITSADIVDGQVKNPDLAANAVTAGKIADASVGQTELKAGSVGSGEIANGSVANGELGANAVKGGKVANDSLTGADVDESSLGRVTDTAQLGGVDAAHFRPGSATSYQRTDQCAQTGIWRLCAPVTLDVPDGELYKVDVNTSMTAWGVTAGQGLFCAAYEGPKCFNDHPSGFTLAPGQYTNVSHNGTAYFGPGSHTFGMAARFDNPIATNDDSAYTTTTIRWHSYYAEVAIGATKAARTAKVPKPLR